MAFDAAKFIDQSLTRASVAKLKRVEIEELVKHLELESKPEKSMIGKDTCFFSSAILSNSNLD